MKRHSLRPIVCTLLAAALGLALPFLAAAGQQLSLSREAWALLSDNAHYTYRGTLMNRVVALNAYLNGSPAVLHAPEEHSGAPDSLAERLAESLPLPPLSTVEASAFSLSPGQYSAQYQYLTLHLNGENAEITLTMDRESSLLLRLEMKCPPEQLVQWLETHSLWDILREYAAYLNLGEPTDDETSISTILRSQSAQLRGTAYKATVTVIPSAGTLLLKLAASTPA